MPLPDAVRQGVYVGLSGRMESGRLGGEFGLGVGLRGGYGIGHFDGSGRYQVAAAKNAAHGYGIDKVGVGPAVSVHADFCCHL